ncbi:MAG: T9SS type A sorting domain-containing protein [Chlorobi bacterium]|nr:T9SS type A sorting domain-containing protein [Chlorobiota bacterium]
MKIAGNILWGFLFLTSALVNGQEELRFPGENPVVRKAWYQLDHNKSLTAGDTLPLPFFDDFSRNTIFPNPALWTDKQAYVNFSYGIDPVSIGVATLDAIDETGAIYTNASTLTFEADHLTSLPIDLDYVPEDGIFFSFFYQPQGIADPPEEGDSLVLLFYAPLQQHWDTVWHHHGETLTPFKEVILPVNDTAFLHKGFRFRFVNFASLTRNDADPGAVANCDHWNIDYVFLDKNRFASDTLPRDVAFTQPLHSLLKTYEAMPWKHFRATFLSEMGSFFPITYRNNDSIIRNVTREFRITNLYTGQTVHSFTGGASNAPADSTITYKAPLIYTFNTPGTDSALFELKSFLITDAFDPKINDTIIRHQVFGKEFAYDDGSAEAGYGLNGNGNEHASLAYQFYAYIPDTLQAVRIWFNHSKDDANLVYFNLMVWNDSAGIPGAVLYKQEGEIPVLSGGNAGFVTFPLDTILIAEGKFYIGWEQVTSTFLNVGFDLNLDHHNRAYIQNAGQWGESSIPGTIMIRPVFGSNLVVKIPYQSFAQQNWVVYPNPADRYIRIRPDRENITRGNLRITLFSLTGKIALTSFFAGDPLNVTGLPDGIYLMTLSNGNQRLFQSKIVILHR